MAVTTTKIKTSKSRTSKSKTKGSKRKAPTETDKQRRKSRRKYDWDYDFLSWYFHMPQKAAAEYLGVATITIKRCCKRHNFEWPYRALKHAAGNRPVLSMKALAFQQLPVTCMLGDDEVMEEEVVMSECETDTESVEGDEQERRDVGTILLLMHDKPVKL